MKYEKRDELSMQAAERITLSDHEHTWTVDEQYEIARHLLKLRKIVLSLVGGLSELASGGYGVKDEVNEILNSPDVKDYYLFKVE